ncbi:MAG: FecR domain-containing protein [Rudaea sp.]|uniref:FecR family protein n=1 Tax=Rudaea sp. TaxID=2136325 RepID=UPI0039E3192A
MNATAGKPASDGTPSAAACAEAAAWIARLHGEERSAKTEAGFKRWLAASPEHRAAFDMANEIWVGAEHLPKPPLPAFVRWPRGGFVLTWPRALAAAAVLVVAATGALWMLRDPGLATRVGEQRTFSLEDGTRISLNTASRVEVHYDRSVRRVELDQGEAFFEVAKRPNWPFVVTAGGRQVTALGTAFLVRRDEQRVAVTLVEGKVTVASASQQADSPSSADSPRPENAAGEAFTLSPGQRLTFVAHEPPKLDRPALEKVTAWQRGRVILDHTPLVDAIAEMNRYSNVKLRIETPQAGQAQVTGTFSAGDSEDFAQAVAETYRLKIEARAGAIVLSGVPSSRDPRAE